MPALKSRRQRSCRSLSCDLPAAGGLRRSESAAAPVPFFEAYLLATKSAMAQRDIHDRRHSDVRLLRTSRWNTCRLKKSADSKNTNNGAPQRIKSAKAVQRRQKSSTISFKKSSLDKDFPVEKCPQPRCKSSNQLSKAINEHCIDKQFKRLTDCSKNSKNTRINATKLEPESYAQMIAKYSEAMYTKSALAALKDGTGFAAINRTHRSPFSTASTITMKPFYVSGASLLNHEANFSTETSSISKTIKNPSKTFIESIGGSEIEKVSSYATIIEKYSNTVSMNIDTRNMLRRKVSPKFDNLLLMLEDTKSVENGRRAQLAERNKKSIWHDLTEVRPENGCEKTEVRQASSIIKDPERIAAMKDDIDAESRPVDARVDLLDRVISAHKKSIRDRELARGGTLKITDENVPNETASPLDNPSAEMSGNKPSNPVSDYLKRGPASQSPRGGQAPSKSSVQSSTTVSQAAREPQIELRMTPSHNESVVAINVEEVAARSAGAKDHLSVVISSRKHASSSAENTNVDSQADFGSMQISISEDTVPVKQIEFSINGKPVSELKSIVARAEKLDVVSSMDKVEIRIPSKDRATSAQTQQAVRTTSHPSAILNLHINAKFNGPRVHQSRDTGVKPEVVPPTSRTTPPGQAPVPPRSHKVFSTSDRETVKLEDVVVRNVEKPVEYSKEPSAGIESVATARKDASSSVAENPDGVNSGVNRKLPRSPQDARLNVQNSVDGSGNREPSNMIPWWSSEEAFKNIKKKGDVTASVETAPNEISNMAAEPKRPAAALKAESTSQSKSIVTSNPVQSPKATVPEKEVKKSDQEIKQPSELLPFSAVRVTSSQRFVPGKMTKPAKQKSRATKKTYRARNVAKMSELPKRSSDTTINTVPPPKIVKFVAVNARPVDVDRKREPETKPRKKVEEDAKKLEGDAAQVVNEKTQKNAETVMKGSDLESSANKSAGVSANAPSSAADQSGSVVAKRETNGEMSGEVETSGEQRGLDRRIKQILETMKPIEKRKDGTLIDYGMTVPSRKSSEQTPRRRSKSVHPVLAMTKTVVDRPTEIVQTEKTSSKEAKDDFDRSKMAKDDFDRSKMAKDDSGPSKMAKDNSDRSKMAKDDSGPSKMAKDNSDRSKMAKDDFDRSKMAKDDFDRSKMAKNDSDRTKMAKDDSDRSKMAKDDSGPSKMAKDDSDRSKIAKDDFDRSKMAKDDSDRSKMAKDDSDRSKMAKDDSDRSKMAKDEKLGGKESAKTKTDPATVAVPVKITSVKKDTLSEPKGVTGQTKIVEPLKISSVKKATAPEDTAEQSHGSERASLTKKLHRGPKNLPYTPRINSEHVFPKQSGQLGDSRAKASVKKTGNGRKFDSVDAFGISESKKLSDGKAKVQNSEVPSKLKDSKEVREPAVKKESKTVFLKESEAGFRGTRDPWSARKTRLHSCPSTSRIVNMKPEEVNKKISRENLNKSFEETGSAPFKGTIRLSALKNEDLSGSSNARKERKVAPSKRDKTEPGGGSSGFSNPLVGPAGLKPSRSFMIRTITSIDNIGAESMVSSIRNESKFREEKKADKIIHEQHNLARNESERPEKSLLYASWLQRFKNSIDDDKML